MTKSISARTGIAESASVVGGMSSLEGPSADGEDVHGSYVYASGVPLPGNENTSVQGRRIEVRAGLG